MGLHEKPAPILVWGGALLIVKIIYSYLICAFYAKVSAGNSVRETDKKDRERGEFKPGKHGYETLFKSKIKI